MYFIPILMYCIPILMYCIPTQTAQFVYWHHNDRTESAHSNDVTPVKQGHSHMPHHNV